jgi:hypothetical protein
MAGVFSAEMIEKQKKAAEGDVQRPCDQQMDAE